MESVILIGDIILFSCLHSEFDKNANSVSVGTKDFFSAEMVWRLSEFAFFVRWLRLAHFFIITVS